MVIEKDIETDTKKLIENGYKNAKTMEKVNIYDKQHNTNEKFNKNISIICVPFILFYLMGAS